MKHQKAFSECYQENTAAAQMGQLPEPGVAGTKSLHLSAPSVSGSKMP